MPEKRIRNGWIIAAILFCIFTAGVGIGGIHWYRNYSVPYQIGKAKECAKAERYVQAITYLEKAHELDQGDGEILFLMADYYYIQGKDEPAIYTLMEIVREEERYPEEDLERAYDKIIAIYSKLGNYQAINELLLHCSDDNIVNAFQQFIAKPPEFSFVGEIMKKFCL